MSLVGSDSTQIYLGQRDVGIAGVGADGRTRWLTADSARAGWRLATELLASERLRRGHRKVRVSLSGALARPFMLEPVPGLRDWREASKVAESLAPEATGLGSPCEVWLGDWRADKSALVVAIDRELRDEIESVSRSAGLQLHCLQPWWSMALREGLRSAPDTRLLLVEDTDALTVLTGDAAAFTSASTYSPLPEADQMEPLIARLCMGSGVPVDSARRATLRVAQTIAAAADTDVFAAALGSAA